MDDRQIQELTRMAIEAEALERSASARDADGPLARLGPQGTGPVRRVLVGAGLGLAAAACLVVGVLMLRPSPAVIPGADRPLVHNDAPRETPHRVETASAEKCVVMSLFRDTSGHCSCLQVSEPAWGRLADVSRSELHRVALSEPCDTMAQQVIIVAIAGRPEALPRSPEQREAIARQVSTAAASIGQHADVTPLARAAMSGLGEETTVVAESVSMRQPSRVGELLQGITGWR